MGTFEHEALERVRGGAPECERWLLGEMTRRVAEAAGATSAVDRGMRFGLPARWIG